MFPNRIRSSGRPKAFALLFLLALLSWVYPCPDAGAVVGEISFDPSPDSRVVGYKLYYGRSVESFDHVVDLGAETSHTIYDLAHGALYYFAASAYDQEGNESDLSEILMFVTPDCLQVEPLDPGVDVPIVGSQSPPTADAGPDQTVTEGSVVRISFALEFSFRASTEHRGALLLRGTDASAAVSDTDPHEVGAAVPLARGLDPAARRIADAVNAFTRRAHEVLRDHPLNKERAGRGKLPANAILLRGAAAMPHLQPVTAEYGIEGSCIAGGALYKGVAKLAGLRVVEVAGATGDLKTDLAAKVRAALSALDSSDLVFVHIKGTDNAAHDGDAEAKRRFIERVDREFFAPLAEVVACNRVHLCVSGDHTTPPAVKEHTADPVPVLFVGPAVQQDPCHQFGERAAGRGGLGRFSGRLVPQLLGYCDLGPKFGS